MINIELDAVEPLPVLPDVEPKFDVHLWYAVRIKIPDVPAKDHREAIKAAYDSLDMRTFEADIDRNLGIHSSLHPGVYLDVHDDLEEGPSEAMVDVIGDTEYRQTLRFDSETSPYAVLCARLLKWHQSDKSQEGLGEILQDVAKVCNRLF